MLPGGFVYILASKSRKLYIGVTSDLLLRVRQHKARLHPEAHSAAYNIDQLVYYEKFESITEAIARESQLKGKTRVKKIQLIVAFNPTWRDLSLDPSPMHEPFNETKLRPPKTFPKESASDRFPSEAGSQGQ